MGTCRGGHGLGRSPAAAAAAGGANFARKHINSIPFGAIDTENKVNLSFFTFVPFIVNRLFGAE